MMELSLEPVKMEVKEEPTLDTVSQLMTHPSQDPLKVEVKEESCDDHTYSTITSSSQLTPTSNNGESSLLLSEGTSIKDEDVLIKEEPVEDEDLTATTTTTFTPKPKSNELTKSSAATEKMPEKPVVIKVRTNKQQASKHFLQSTVSPSTAHKNTGVCVRALNDTRQRRVTGNSECKQKTDRNRPSRAATDKDGRTHTREALRDDLGSRDVTADTAAASSPVTASSGAPLCQTYNSTPLEPPGKKIKIIVSAGHQAAPTHPVTASSSDLHCHSTGPALAPPGNVKKIVVSAKPQAAPVQPTATSGKTAPVLHHQSHHSAASKVPQMLKKKVGDEKLQALELALESVRKRRDRTREFHEQQMELLRLQKEIIGMNMAILKLETELQKNMIESRRRYQQVKMREFKEEERH